MAQLKLLAVGRWFLPGAPDSSMAIAEAISPDKLN